MISYGISDIMDTTITKKHLMQPLRKEENLIIKKVKRSFSTLGNRMIILYAEHFFIHSKKEETYHNLYKIPRRLNCCNGRVNSIL